MPVYSLMVIFLSPTFMVHLPSEVKRVIFLLASVNMTVVPLSIMPLLKYRKLINSYHMDTRAERLIPLSLGTMMYIVTTIIFYSYQIPLLIKSFLLAASITSALVLFTTFVWKISVHSAGMGALLATAVILSVRMHTGLLSVWLPLLLLTGLVMASRLYLGSHRPAQVYAGFLLGFLTIFSVMMIS